jgi:thiamine pyrophosphate-dependent acetolactate synthase large subunit-like protein
MQQQGNRSGDFHEIVRFGPSDFGAIARGFGVRAVRVELPNDLVPALASALAADETVVVDVVTDIDSQPQPPWKPDNHTATGVSHGPV